MENVKIFAANDSWIEGEAVRQLEHVAQLPGIVKVAGMPDLHPGKGCPVGAVAYSRGIIYPHLIGNDIGCGFSLFSTDIPVAKFKAEKAADKLTGLDTLLSEEEKKVFSGDNSEIDYSSIGTIGGGNHFAELQKIVEITDDRFNELQLNPDNLVLLIHSGSRNIGEEIFRKYAAICGGKGLIEGSEDFSSYMQEHNRAVRWASMNRIIVANRFLACLSAKRGGFLDIPHNFIELFADGYLHRKGAAPSNQGFSPLPGSRGTPTYILKQDELHGDSLNTFPHGAGRKTSRSNMKERNQKSAKELIHTPLGGYVICGDDNLLREEHHTAYKNVDKVLADVVETKLGKSVATLHPVLTYKSERVKDKIIGNSKREKEENWRRDRRDSNRKRK